MDDVEIVARASDEDASESYDGSDCSLPSYSELNWYLMPDLILLSIFQYLTPKELTTAGEVCKSWYTVSRNEFLWKYLFYRTYKIDPDVGIVPGKTSWLGEFKRMAYHTPLIETEILKEHSHQVLHVSFSHNGKMFATCSKDGYILVWQSQYPVTIKYLHDMKTFDWKYTQFSQFNCTDTLLLVFGVYTGSFYKASDEIAVFRVATGFDLQCRVQTYPDINDNTLGLLYNERYLLSGNMHWLTYLVGSSVDWFDKPNQELSGECEHVPIMMQHFRFSKTFDIDAIMVANCLAPAPAESTEQQSQPSSSNTKEEKRNPPSHKDLLSPAGEFNSSQNQEEPVYYIRYKKLEGAFSNWRKLDDDFEYANPIQYNQEYRQVEMQKKVTHESDSESENPQGEKESESGESSITEECDTDKLANNPEKLLIFTIGSKSYIPHAVGFKKIKLVTFLRRLDPGSSLRERIAQQKRERERQNTPSMEDWLNYELVEEKIEKIDHLIDLHSKIFGMGLSPDHRYLYVNTMPSQENYAIINFFEPPIAQECNIHVIDLVTLKQVRTILRGHKANMPSNEYFFIFLDVCNEYVASGAEDKHGYLWDRHYGICLAKFPHSDVVNSVAFNPRDPEMLVTTSKDCTVKIWRSRAMVKALGLDEKSYRKRMEV